MSNIQEGNLHAFVAFLQDQGKNDHLTIQALKFNLAQSQEEIRKLQEENTELKSGKRKRMLTADSGTPEKRSDVTAKEVLEPVAMSDTAADEPLGTLEKIDVVAKDPPMNMAMNDEDVPDPLKLTEMCDEVSDNLPMPMGDSVGTDTDADLMVEKEVEKSLPEKTRTRSKSGTSSLTAKIDLQPLTQVTQRERRSKKKVDKEIEKVDAEMTTKGHLKFVIPDANKPDLWFVNPPEYPLINQDDLRAELEATQTRNTNTQLRDSQGKKQMESSGGWVDKYVDPYPSKEEYLRQKLVNVKVNKDMGLLKARDNTMVYNGARPMYEDASYTGWGVGYCMRPAVTPGGRSRKEDLGEAELGDKRWHGTTFWMCIEIPNTWIGILPSMDDQEDQAFAPYFFWRNKDKEDYWNTVSQRGGQIASGKTGQTDSILGPIAQDERLGLFHSLRIDPDSSDTSQQQKPERKQSWQIEVPSAPQKVTLKPAKPARPPRAKGQGETSRRAEFMEQTAFEETVYKVINHEETQLAYKQLMDKRDALVDETTNRRDIQEPQAKDLTESGKGLKSKVAEQKISPRLRKPISPVTRARQDELKCREAFGEKYVKAMQEWEVQMAGSSGEETPATPAEQKAEKVEEGSPYPEMVIPKEWQVDEQGAKRLPLTPVDKDAVQPGETYVPSSLLLPEDTNHWLNAYKERLKKETFYSKQQWEKLNREYTDQTYRDDFLKGRSVHEDHNKRREEQQYYKVTHALQELDLVNFPDTIPVGADGTEPFNEPFFPSFMEDYHPLFKAMLEIPQKTFYRYYTTIQLSNIRSLMGRQMDRRREKKWSEAECRRETIGFPCYPDSLALNYVEELKRVIRLRPQLKSEQELDFSMVNRDLENLENMMFLPKKKVFTKYMVQCSEHTVDVYLTDLVLKLTTPTVDPITKLVIIPDRYLDRWVNGRTNWQNGLCGKGPSSAKICEFAKCGQVGHDENHCPMYTSDGLSWREPETPVLYEDSKWTLKKGYFKPGAEMATAPRCCHTIGDIEQFAYSDLMLEFLTNAAKFPGPKKSHKRKSDGIGNEEYLYLAERLPVFKATFPLFADLTLRAREANPRAKKPWNEVEYIGDFFEYVSGVAKHMGYWPILAGIGAFMLNNRYHWFYEDPKGPQYAVPDRNWGEESLVRKDSLVDKWLLQARGSLDKEDYMKFWEVWPGIKDSKAMQTFEREEEPHYNKWAPKVMVVNAGVAPLLQGNDSPIVLNWWSYYLGVTTSPQSQLPMVEKPWELIILATKKMCASSQRLTGRALVAQTAAILKASPTRGAGSGASKYKLKIYTELRDRLIQAAKPWLKKHEVIINALNRKKRLEFPPMVIKFTEAYIQEIPEDEIERIPTPDFDDEDRSRELSTYVEWLNAQNVSEWVSTPRKEKTGKDSIVILTPKESAEQPSRGYAQRSADQQGTSRWRRTSDSSARYQKTGRGWGFSHPHGGPEWDGTN